MATHEDGLYGIKKISIDYKEDDATLKLSNFLTQAIKSNTKQNITFLCIGTDRSTGDCFAPLIGTMLTQNHSLDDVDILGTLQEPVHAKNLDEYISKIHKDDLVIAIDSALGRSNSIGKITISEGKMKPGMGVGKALTEIGDISIGGVVNMESGLNPQMNFTILQNTQLGRVWAMAEVVAGCIARSISALRIEESRGSSIYQIA